MDRAKVEASRPIPWANLFFNGFRPWSPSCRGRPRPHRDRPVLRAEASIRAFGWSFLAERSGILSRRCSLAPCVCLRTLVTSALALLLGVPISLASRSSCRACTALDPNPAHVRGRAPRRGALGRLRPLGIFVLAPVMRTAIETGHPGDLRFPSALPRTPIGLDKFSAGVILAIMIIPTISSCHGGFSRRPGQPARGRTEPRCHSLGDDPVAVLRYARAGFFGAVILGLGRASGRRCGHHDDRQQERDLVSLFDQDRRSRAGSPTTSRRQRHLSS